MIQLNNRKAATILAWVTALVFIAFLVYWILLIPAPSPNVAGVENNTIYFIQRLLDGSPIYTDPAAAPYAVAQYTPLYYCLVAAVAKLTGIGPDNVLGLFIVSRTVSLVLILLTSGITFYISRLVFQYTIRRSAMLFAFVFIFMEISSFNRADSLSNMLYFLSLLFFLGALKNAANKRLLIISGVIAALSVFAKQSELVLPAACCLGMLRMKQYRDLLVYGIAFAVALAAGLVIIHFTDGTGIFLKNVIKGVDNGFDFSGYVYYIVGEFLAIQGLLWLMLTAVVAGILYRQKSPVSSFLLFLLLVQLIASCVFAMKKGSSSNYFTEWWILVLVATACCWDHITGILSSIDRRLCFLLPAVLLVLRVSGIVYPVYAHLAMQYKRAGNTQYANEAAVAAYIRPQLKDKLVFNNVFSPDSYLNCLLFRQAIVPQNDVVTLGTYDREVFDYTGLRRQLASGEVMFVVHNMDEPAPGFLPMEMRYYKEDTIIGNYKLFKYQQVLK